MKEMTGAELEKQLNEKGWKPVYQMLKGLHETLEKKQVFLYSDPSTVDEGSKMAPMLLKQDMTLLVIEKEAKEKSIDIGELHK